ncbi:major facilitator superfamily domain-containing protein [Lipomyces arxii]|uniref:major facilitator superfamily domain-containing protein n=1 Tax=Lipomyces arxii TaxID=56418 RepID=UPI0034CF953F
MWDIVRSSFGGEIIHFLSGGRLFQYPDQKPGFVIPKKFGASTSAEDIFKLTEFVSGGHNVHHGQEDIPDADLENNKLASKMELDDGSTAETAADEKTLSPEYIVDWYGPDDPENPHNWSLKKKLFVIFEISWLTVAVYAGSAMYTPGAPEIARDLHVSEVAALLPLSGYVMAYGIGPMILAPMSEMPMVGRNWVYMPFLFLFVILQIPTALVSNFGGFLILRIITGFVSSSPLSNGGASIGDVVHFSALPYALGGWSVAAVAGPVLGPLLGSVFAQIKNWRWTFWFLCWLSGSTFVLLLFFFPETAHATILERRARRFRKMTGNNKYTTKAMLEFENFTATEFAYESLVRPFLITFTEFGVLFLNVYTALIYAVMYSWFEAFPIVFLELYHFNLIEMGVSYVGLLIGVCIACCIFCTVWKFKVAPALSRGVDPEKIFYVALCAAPILPAGLMLFGWSATASIHWVVPIIGSGVFLVGGFHIFQCVFNYLGMSYPRYLASVFAGNDMLRSVFAASFPLFARAMFVNLDGPGHNKKFPVAFGATLLAGISACMIVIPVFILLLGRRLRATSKYAN